MNCHRKNHFAKCCLSKRKVDQVSSTSSLSQKNESNDDENEFYIEAINNNKASIFQIVNHDWNISVVVNGVNIQFKMDSGAQANILPVSEIKSMIPQPELKQTSTKLHIMVLIYLCWENFL